MMECNKTRKLLPDYSVGNFAEKKREEIKQHIDNCPSCARELMYLDKTAYLLDSIPQEEPPDFLWEGVRRAIIQQESSQDKQPIFQRVFSLFCTLNRNCVQNFGQWMWTKRIPAFAASLAILILVAGVVYFTVLNQPSESQSTFYAEMEQQTFSHWSSPFADRAALGVLVTNTSLEGGDYETFR